MSGIKPQRKVKIQWSPKFAYAIGLLASDGNLSKDGRHMNFTSKDYELISHFKKCFQLSNRITRKKRGTFPYKKYYFIQFGDILFYRYLLSMGFMPAKSKVIGILHIPKKYFFDFLRGSFDGDGTFYSYYDPRWKSSFMFYTVFASASEEHILWLRNTLQRFLKVNGHVTYAGGGGVLFQLKYAKRESLKVLRKMYTRDAISLKRKRLKIQKALDIIGLTL